MAQEVKSLLVMPLLHLSFGSSTGGFASIQTPANAPGKAVDDAQIIKLTTWESQRGFLPPGFRLAQSLLLQPSEEQTSSTQNQSLFL